MKALVLAAGFGQRLAPYTYLTPKPLFHIANRPLLDIVLRNLSAAGISAITVNTHHLHHKIETYLTTQSYDIPVKTRHEPEILGTGGAIKNLVDFWDDEPFMVVNSDILFNTDLPAFIRFHQECNALATLLLCDNANFNQVWVDQQHLILGFGLDHEPSSGDAKTWTFTGIQIIDPQLLDFIPEKAFYSVIDAYRKALTQNRIIQAFIPKLITWTDIGSPQRFRQAAVRSMVGDVFADEDPDYNKALKTIKLAGDGSDRCWYRFKKANTSIIMTDHGIRSASGVQEVDAFIKIGQHLLSCGVKVPMIISTDPFSGLVLLQDLGDQHLQDVVQKQGLVSDIVGSLYKSFIIQLVHMGTVCHPGFDSNWTYQSATYDQSLVLENECRYFVTAFLNDYLKMSTQFEDLLDEFQLLAQKAATCQYQGFMHRDMQSRNIMVYQDQCFIIDFQGARIGPLAYDLASLLIDPYVALPSEMISEFYDSYVQQLSKSMGIDRASFRNDYEICRLTRNLQILGAFGHLARNQGKTQFEAYIPRALATLSQNLDVCYLGDRPPGLCKVVRKAQARLKELSHKQ